MKLLRIALIALLLSPIFFFTTGCGDDTVVVPDEDTTPIIVAEINNRFTAGFDQYDLEIDKNSTYGYFRKADGKTIIQVKGDSKAKAGTPIVTGNGEVEIILAGKDVGVYKQADNDDVILEVATGEGVKREEFSYDQNSNIIVEITQYDSIGGFIQGTFSGTLKAGINTRVIKGGEFKVERTDDQ